MPEPAITPLDQRQVDDLECVLGARTCRKLREQNLTARAPSIVIFGECSPDGQGRVEVRAFAPSCVVNQGPVYGSGNSAVAAFLQYTSQIGRADSIHLAICVDPINAGGAAATCLNGNTAI